MNNKKQVYMIYGFLESGKTQFINFTLNQDYFYSDDTTLLIVCEEGEEEYDIEALKEKNVVVEVLDDFTDFNLTTLKELDKQYKPERILIEYNGTWSCKEIIPTGRCSSSSLRRTAPHLKPILQICVYCLRI